MRKAWCLSFGGAKFGVEVFVNLALLTITMN